MMGVACCLCKFSNATVCSIKSRRFSSSLLFSTVPSGSHPFSSTVSPTPSIKHSLAPLSASVSATGGTCMLTWDDVFRISESEAAATEDPSCYLQSYFHKVQLCNRASIHQP